jgi:hypothetical protein
MHFRQIDVLRRHIVEIAGHSAALCAYKLFLLLPKLYRKGSARRAQRHAQRTIEAEDIHKTRRSI